MLECSVYKKASILTTCFFFTLLSSGQQSSPGLCADSERRLLMNHSYSNTKVQHILSEKHSWPNYEYCDLQ